MIEFPQPRPDLPFPMGLRGVAHRPENFNHRALVINPVERTTPKPEPWNRTSASTFYQQGSSCTFQAAIGVCITLPYRYSFQPDRWRYDTEEERHQGYLEAQQYDPWAGGELWVPGQPGGFYEGSSTDAPYILLRNLGIIPGWVWIFGEEELWRYVSFVAPASVGTLWTEGMVWPDSQGYIKPSGPDVGGHAYEIIWASHARQAYRIVNSWSTEWGQLGRAWITRAHMRWLLEQDGEAVSIRLPAKSFALAA